MPYPVRLFEYARIANVIDGGTCDIEVDLGFGVVVKQRFRLSGINTPKSCEPGCSEATAFLRQFEGHEALIDVQKLDAYGRYLAEITIPSFSRTSLNERMVDMGLAEEYR